MPCRSGKGCSSRRVRRVLRFPALNQNVSLEQVVDASNYHHSRRSISSSSQSKTLSGDRSSLPRDVSDDFRTDSLRKPPTGRHVPKHAQRDLQYYQWRHLPLATYVAEDRAKMFDMDNANPIPYYTAATKIRSRRGGSIGERRVQITQMR